MCGCVRKIETQTEGGGNNISPNPMHSEAPPICQGRADLGHSTTAIVSTNSAGTEGKGSKNWKPDEGRVQGRPEANVSARQLSQP